MPNPTLSAMAKEAGISMDRAEHLWSKAKKAAADEGKKEDWAYVMGIFKKMAKVGEESTTEVKNLIDRVVDGELATKVLEAIGTQK